MKNATPSDKRISSVLQKINTLEIAKIAIRYRKNAGIDDHQFDFLVDVDDEYDWTSFLLRTSFFQDIFVNDKNFQKILISFRKVLVKKCPEYQHLIMRDDWKPIIIELLVFGEIQIDTYKHIPLGNISWVQERFDGKSLYLKIDKGADKKQIIEFLNWSENNISERFKQISTLTDKRKRKAQTLDLDLWVRVLDTFSSEQIRGAFAINFSKEYTEKFTDNGNRNKLARAKYELIAHYLFHRFGLKDSKSRVYSAEYIRTIAQKSSNHNTKLKSGSFNKVP